VVVVVVELVVVVDDVVVEVVVELVVEVVDDVTGSSISTGSASSTDRVPHPTRNAQATKNKAWRGRTPPRLQSL